MEEPRSIAILTYRKRPDLDYGVWNIAIANGSVLTATEPTPEETTVLSEQDKNVKIRLTIRDRKIGHFIINIKDAYAGVLHKVSQSLNLTLKIPFKDLSPEERDIVVSFIGESVVTLIETIEVAELISIQDLRLQTCSTDFLTTIEDLLNIKKIRATSVSTSSNGNTQNYITNAD